MAENLVHYWTNVAFEPSMVFTNVMYAVCVAVLFRPIKRSVRSILLLAAHIAVLYIVLTSVNGLFTSIPGGREWHSAAMFVGNALVLGVYAVAFGRYSPAVRVVYCVSFFAAERCVNVLTGLLPSLLVDFAPGYWMDIVIRFVLTGATILIPLFLRRFGWNKLGAREGSAGGIVFVVVYSVFSIVTASYCTIALGDMSRFVSGFAFVAITGCASTEILGYWLAYHMQSSNRENLELLAIAAERESSEELLRQTDENIDELRKIRHDIKNWIANMRLLLGSGQYDELREFFGSVEERVNVPLSGFDCGNKIVNAIVNLELRKARDMSVRLDAKAAVPRELPFSGSDLCSLLTNLIDNALEGAARGGRTDEPVKVGMRLAADGYLYITVSNPVSSAESKKELLSARTTKKDPLLHGYGTRIADEIVRRYNGAINRGVADGRYTADVMLDAAGCEKKEGGHAV